VLKTIIHDWSDEYATKILKRVRDASSETTKLVVVDRIIPYACRLPENGEHEEDLKIPGIQKDETPEPLFPHFGGASISSSRGDLNMMVLVNGQERTITHFRKLFQSTGWHISRVHQTDASGQVGSLIEALPI